MIVMLGQGPLWQVHRHKQRWLTEAERRKAFILITSLASAITTLVYLWILR